MLTSKAARAVRERTRRRRQRAFNRAMRELTAGLEPKARARALAVVYLLVSAPAWQAMREQSGLGRRRGGQGGRVGAACADRRAAPEPGEPEGGRRNDDRDDGRRRAGVHAARPGGVDARRDALDAAADALPGRALSGAVQARLRREPAPVRVAARLSGCRVRERVCVLPAAAGRGAGGGGCASAAGGLGRSSPPATPRSGSGWRRARASSSGSCGGRISSAGTAR